jgi:hypothetical protein
MKVNKMKHTLIKLSRRLTCLGSICILFLATSSWARPSIRVVTQTEDDATITLTLESQFIEDDVNIPCEVNVLILDDEVDFSEGDTILISVKEDDLIGDDLFWETEEIVTEQIVTAGQFERTYDCRFPSTGDALGNLLEVYARVEVDKDECSGIFCLQDHLSTSNISILKKTDDMAEDDDENREGTIVEQRLFADRISTDSDWYQLNFSFQVELLARLESLLRGGDLDLKLYDESLNLIASATPESTGEAKSLRPPSSLSPGQYFLEVIPSVVDDFNFYDLHVVESEVMGDCLVGDIERRSCGFCGNEERVCNGGGEWSMWSNCLGMGTCEPGAEESEGCGEAGNRNRLCSVDCQWMPYSECIECENGSVESCYTGSEEQAGIGACVEGTRSCSRGQWSSCQGDVLPRTELCDDGVDNDCNGFIDGNDSVCAAEVGDACLGDSCGEGLECLSFPGGYCGGGNCSNCASGSVCGDVAGQAYCLKPCTGPTDCRSGYICADAGSNGQSVCIPPCRSEQDCGVGQVCGAERFCETAAVLGDACDQSDECASPWSCLTGAFSGGYCGGTGCGQCGAGGVCGQVRGQEYCLEPCNASSDCRTGYLCALQSGTSDVFACVPPCVSDADCGVGKECGMQGICEVLTPGAGVCGMSGTCAIGEVCGLDPQVGMQACLAACSSDENCGEGKVCGVEGFCVEASGVDIISDRSESDSGCEHSPKKTVWWLLMPLLVISMSRRRQYLNS